MTSLRRCFAVLAIACALFPLRAVAEPALPMPRAYPWAVRGGAAMAAAPCNAVFVANVSADVINRLVDDKRKECEFVHDVILDADVYGPSRTKSRAKIQLVPDPYHVTIE